MFSLSSTVKNAIWPWLFNHNDDIGVFLRLGGHDLIRWYAICILTGMLICLYRCKRELAKRGYPKDYYDNFFLSVIVVAIVGCRLWYVISNPDDFKKGSFFESFLAIIGYENGKFALSGLAIQGGVLASVIWGCIYFTRIKKRIPLAFHIDLILPTILIGQILGRWGNFFNGEVYGKEVSRKALSWWIPKFCIDYCTGTGSLSQVGESMVHIPLFYVEGLINIFGFILIGILAFKFWKKGRRGYQVGALYFIWYGVVRLLLEPLRENQYIMSRTIFGLEVRTSILMSSLFVIIGVVAFIVMGIIYRKTPIEKAYVNEAYEAALKEKEDEKKAELEAKIQAKKEEIRARKAKENG